MAIIEIRKITDEPQDVQDVSDYADFIIGILLRDSAGAVETEYQRRQGENGSDTVNWFLTSRSQGEKKIVWTSSGLAFRPALANIGWRFLNNPYGGHANFRVRYEGETEIQTPGFSLFLCNEWETGVWLKVYRRRSPLKNKTN